MVAFSSAAFLSSNSASGSPLTNSTTSGRRLVWARDVQVDVGDGELVDRQPVVGARIGEIDQPDFVVLELPAVAVGDVDAFGQQAVEGVIVDQRVLALGAADLADGFVDGAGASGRRDVGVDAIQRRPQPTEQQHLAVAGALGGGFTRRDVAAEDDTVAEFMQPFERREFDRGFAEVMTHRPLPNPRF